jgi:DUF4097 and DUF4098 domain-containing protein YvlB
MSLLGFSSCIGVFPAAEGRFERTLHVAGPIEMDISTGSGAIDVHTGSPGTVRVYGEIKARHNMFATADEKVSYIEAHPPIEMSGNTIRIGHITDPAYRTNVSVSYEIQVPSDTKLAASTGSGGQRIDGVRRAVTATTGSGSITISNIEGDVRAQTGSGGIELNSVNGRANLQTGSGSIKADSIAGSIRAETGSGHIALALKTIEQGAPLDVEAHTGSGGIDVSGVYGSVKAGTGSGSIRISGTPIREWNIHTSSGGIVLEMAPDAAFDLHAKTGSGQIRIDQPVEVRGRKARNEVEGKVRGGGSIVEAFTSSGGITIR